VTVLIGLDLSCTAAPAVAVPLDWDGQWSRVHSVVVGEKLRRDSSDAERARRTETIASRLVAFAQAERATVAFIEGNAFSQHTAAHTLGELGGVVRLELVRAGIEIRTANMSTSRRLLLGKCCKGAKVAAYTTLKTAGAMFETLDQSDAFTAVNLGLSELGGYCYAQTVV
jgi:hypothetical protein